MTRDQEAILALTAEIERLRALVAKGNAVVQDFMPNIGRCALQRYDLLNEFTFEAAAIVRKADQPPASLTPCAPCDATGAVWKQGEAHPQICKTCGGERYLSAAPATTPPAQPSEVTK